MSNCQSLIKQMTAQGLRNRPAQVQMLENVYEAVKQQAVLCVEAPTGTGKTLAYCLGALSARQDDQVLVVSTATTALQEQFFQKDLVLLEKILQRKLSVVLAKGRRRYVCQSRLFNPEQFLEEIDAPDQLVELQQAFEDKSWQGEFDKLPIKLDSNVWQKISTDASGCSAGRCAYFNECVFFQNRRKMYSADIVVTNHSLLLSDLELGGGVILPEMAKSIYILDECHHLPDKALSHFAKQAAVLRSFDWLNNIGKTINKIAIQIKIKQQSADDLNHYVKNLVEVLRQIKKFLDASPEPFQENQLRLTQLPEFLAEAAKTIIDNCSRILTILQKVSSDLDAAYEEQNAQDKTRAEVISHLQTTLNFILDRCDNLQATWRDLLDLAPLTVKIPMACWFEKHDARDDFDYTLHTSPINVSEAMKSLFWDKLENAAILCSATIRAMGKFNDFLRKLGLKDNAKVKEQILLTPFEHQHSVLFVPAMQYEPTQALQTQHLNEVLQMLPELILPNSGTLILFTSRKAMWQVFQQMPENLKKNILLQDDYSKMDLIERHKKKVDSKKLSIIFGLASFAEGIDLPGEYCQHVIIQKIPFTVPSDPISQTRSEWLKKHQADPFQLVTLPETSIKLAQYIGRLLRHEDDRGMITILDKRLYTKQYGKLLLENLPTFTRLINGSLAQFRAHELVERFY